MTPSDRGLPVNLDAERFVLGSILLDDTHYSDVAGVLTCDDFSLEKHRRIFKRMGEVYGRGERIDRLTVFSRGRPSCMRQDSLERRWEYWRPQSTGARGCSAGE